MYATIIYTPPPIKAYSVYLANGYCYYYYYYYYHYHHYCAELLRLTKEVGTPDTRYGMYIISILGSIR